MPKTLESKGTIRMLLAVAAQDAKPSSINAAIVLAFDGAPYDAGFALGDDITMGEGDFADANVPAEFHHTDDLTTGLWIAEWDWLLADDEDDFPEAKYGEERWSRPTLDDLIAFEMLAAPSTGGRDNAE